MPVPIVTTFFCTNADCTENGVLKGAVTPPPEGVVARCGVCNEPLTEDASRVAEYGAVREDLP